MLKGILNSRLTVTLDVFKFEHFNYLDKKIERLTVTLDVFK